MGGVEASQMMNGTELTALEIFEYYKRCLKGSQPGWMSESDLKQYTENLMKGHVILVELGRMYLAFTWTGTVFSKINGPII